jgi:hypothetical protein
MPTYFSVNALESQRSSGYKNTTFAIAELIDNAFDSGAMTCKVIFIEKRGSDNKRYIDEVLIADDGEGMSDEKLKFCLQFGGTTNDDINELVLKKKIGKFGYGLPNASLSQCPSILVASWISQGLVFSSRLDLEELKNSQSIEIPELEPFSFPEYYESVGAVINESHGTIVSWKKCDRLSNSKAETIISKSEKLLGRLFRYLLASGRKIELTQYEYSSTSGQYVEQGKTVVRKNDPLFLMEDTVISTVLYQASKDSNGAEAARDPAQYYSRFSIGPDSSKPTNLKLEDQSFRFNFEWRGKEYSFDIITSYAHPDIQKPGIREGGDTSVGKFYKEKEKECINFVRSGREISAGNYGFYNQADPRQRWWSIEVSFTPDADELLGVHNNKQGVDFVYSNDVDPTEVFEKYTASLQQAREQLWCELTKKIERARKEVWKEILNAQKKWELSITPEDTTVDGEPILPGGTQTTTKIQKDTDGVRARQFSQDEKDALFERLKEKYTDIPHDDILRTIDLYDLSKLRGCVLYSQSASDQLWSLTNVGNFLITLINTNHMFYQNMIEPLKMAGRESSLAAIELFISSLAWEEYQHFASGNNKNVIEEFRSYVGIHLNRYLREFTYRDEIQEEDADE